MRLNEGAAVDDAAVLFERYSERIYAYCLHVLRDRGEAEDAVQTTFLNAHRALQRGVTPEHEYAWLHTIAKNACRMQQRTKGRRAPVADVDVDTIPGHDDGTSDADELRTVLAEALTRLPETQRRAVVLREWHGLTPLEIAPRLGLSVPATYALLTRARRSLANALTATVRGPLAVLDLSALAGVLRGLKASLGGGASKTAVAAVVTTATVGVGGVVVDRSLRDTPDRSAPPPVVAVATSAAGATAKSRALSSPRTPARGRLPRPTAPRTTTTRVRTAPIRSTPAATPTTAEKVPAAPPSDSPEPGSPAAPETARSSPPAPKAAVEPAELPLVPPLLEDLGLGDPLPPAEVPPLPPVPDLPLDELLPPPPQLPVP